METLVVGLVLGILLGGGGVFYVMNKKLVDARVGKLATDVKKDVT